MSIDHKELLASFAEEFDHSSSRSCAIISGAVIDDLLGQLLRKIMRPDTPNEIFSGYGPLSTFSAKIDIAYCLGCITKGEKIELHLIRKIRNEFAHAITSEVDFFRQPVIDHVNRLKLSGTKITKKKTSPRDDFRVSVLVLIGFMIGNIESNSKRFDDRDFIEMLHNKSS